MTNENKYALLMEQIDEINKLNDKINKLQNKLRKIRDRREKDRIKSEINQCRSRINRIYDDIIVYYLEDNDISKKSELMEKFISVCLKKTFSIKYTSLRKHYDLFLSLFSRALREDNDENYAEILYKCYVLAKYDEGRDVLRSQAPFFSSFVNNIIQKLVNAQNIENKMKIKDLYEMFIALCRVHLSD